MKWYLIAVSSLGLLVGCQENSKPMPRGLLGPGGQPLVPAVAAPEVARAKAVPPPEPGPQFQAVPSPFGSAVPPPAAVAPPQAVTAAPPALERDLSSELAVLIPAPGECL